MNEQYDSDHDAMGEDEQPLTPWEISELESLASLQPVMEPMTLAQWEEKREAQEYAIEYGVARTAEDYRAKASYDANMMFRVMDRRAA